MLVDGNQRALCRYFKVLFQIVLPTKTGLQAALHLAGQNEFYFFRLINTIFSFLAAGRCLHVFKIIIINVYYYVMQTSYLQWYQYCVLSFHFAPFTVQNHTQSHCSLEYTVSGKKRPQFFLHNFNKCRRNFVIFCMNHPEDSLY